MDEMTAHDNLVILLYEAQKEREKRASCAKHQPLSKALKYAKNKWGTCGCRTYQHMKWKKDWEDIVYLVCVKFGNIKKITDIDPNCLDQANAYAIKLIDSWKPLVGKIKYR